MRGEFTRIGGNSEPLADAFDLGLKRIEFGRGRNTCIDAVRFFGAESIDAGKVKHKLGTPHAVKRMGNLVGHMAFHIADKT